MRNVNFRGALRLPIRVAQALYRRIIRAMLPGEPVVYDGIKTAVDRKWGDDALPVGWKPEGTKDAPDYEEKLLLGINRVVKPGHRVTVIGGGHGITAIAAALRTGPSGAVTCYEAGRGHARAIRRAARRNAVHDRLTVKHAVVGKAVDVWGTGSPAPVFSATSLPECDVLEMDCEGSERLILDEMTIRPPAILVETHGHLGAPTDSIGERLIKMGYDVEDLGLTEPSMAAGCEQCDIRVLLAVAHPGVVGSRQGASMLRNKRS